MKTEKGIKTVMSILVAEKKSNKAFVVALSSSLTLKHSPNPPSKLSKLSKLSKPSTPATGSVSALALMLPTTNIKLQSIFKNA